MERSAATPSTDKVTDLETAKRLPVTGREGAAMNTKQRAELAAIARFEMLSP
jgi:hypothetical protein